MSSMRSEVAVYPMSYALRVSSFKTKKGCLGKGSASTSLPRKTKFIAMLCASLNSS